MPSFRKCWPCLNWIWLRFVASKKCLLTLIKNYNILRKYCEIFVHILLFQNILSIFLISFWEEKNAFHSGAFFADASAENASFFDVLPKSYWRSFIKFVITEVLKILCALLQLISYKRYLECTLVQWRQVAEVPFSWNPR